MTTARRSQVVDTLIEGACRAARGEPAAFLAARSILVVDDEGRGLRHLNGVLTAVGGPDVEISTARTAAAALDISKSQHGRFDLVLLNYLLSPGCGTGIELLPALRRAGLAAAAKAVLYSETMDRSLEQRACAAGFDGTMHTDTMDAATLRSLLARLLAPAAPRARPE